MTKRDIKFRAWSSIHEAMLGTVSRMHWKDNKVEYLCVEGSNPPHDSAEVHGDSVVDAWITLEQYTGFKDINGVEIYEGDILRHTIDDSIYYFVVKWKDGFFGIKQIGGISKMPMYIHKDIYDVSFEVVGNVHQNPELLEV